ncbi:hypothetical protein [Kitasatospora sp. NPDC004272]
MRTRPVLTRTAAGLLAAGLALALSSCDFPGSDSKGGGAKGGGAGPAATASASGADWAELAGAEAAMLGDLADIDPGLVTDQEKAIAGADTVCEAIRAGKSEDEVARTAGAEFTTDEIKPDLGVVSRIVDVLKSTTCV